MSVLIVNEEFIKEHRHNPDFYDVIYRQYEKLIHSIAHKYYIKGYEHEDLVSEGAIRFFHVLNKWNPDLDFKFSTYLGLSLHNHYKGMLRQQDTEKRGCGTTIISLDTPVSCYGDNLYIKDVLNDDSSLTAFEPLPSAESLLLKYCSSSVKKARDKEILFDYFMEELKQNEISGKYNISQAQISRIIKKHSNKMKEQYERGQI